MNGDAKIMNSCTKYLLDGTSGEIIKASCFFIKKHPHLMTQDNLDNVLTYLARNITTDSCVDALEALSTLGEPYNKEARQRVYAGMELMRDLWAIKYALNTLYRLHGESIPAKIILDVAVNRVYRVFSADTIQPYAVNLDCEVVTTLLDKQLHDGRSVYSDRTYTAAMFAMMTPRTNGSAYQCVRDMFYIDSCARTRNEVLTGVSSRWSGPISSRFHDIVRDTITSSFEDSRIDNIVLALSLIPRMGKRARMRLEGEVMSIVKSREPSGAWQAAVCTAIQMKLPVMYEALYKMTNTLSIAQRVEFLELISKNQ